MGQVALKVSEYQPGQPPGYTYYDQITFGPGSPGDRPHPLPPPPGSNLPTDPGYGIDVGGGYRPPGRPSHPIALPGDPWWGTGTPPTPGAPPDGFIAVIKAPPEDFVPPVESAPDAKWVQLLIHKGAPPAYALVQPYVAPLKK
jgi:hypothetical protein